MKKIFFPLSIFLLISLLSYSQNGKTLKTDTLKIDTIFSINASFVIWNIASCELHKKSFSFLDIYSEFLKSHLDIGLIIIRRNPQKAILSSSNTQCRTESIKKYFISKGVEENRLIAKGIDIVYWTEEAGEKLKNTIDPKTEFIFFRLKN